MYEMLYTQSYNKTEIKDYNFIKILSRTHGASTESYRCGLGFFMQV